MVDISRGGLDSRVLAWLRLPLAVLVVFIHTNYPQQSMPVYLVGNFLSNGLAYIAVPAFFFISGYLFFAKYQSFGAHEYMSAMSNRFFSLAVPYFLWIFLVFYGEGFLFGFNPDWYSPRDVYRVFWATHDDELIHSALGYSFYGEIYPAGYYSMWFIRDLMVVSACAPLIWWVARRAGMWSIAIFVALYMFNIKIPVDGFGLVAFTFFPIGATFAICGKSISEFAMRYRWAILTVLGLLLATVYCLDVSGTEYDYSLVKLLKLSGLGAMVLAAIGAMQFGNFADAVIMLGETSMFIYLAHPFPGIVELGTATIAPATWWGALASYLFGALGRVAVCIAIYYLLKLVCPHLLGLLVGQRNMSASTQKLVFAKQ